MYFIEIKTNTFIELKRKLEDHHVSYLLTFQKSLNYQDLKKLYFAHKTI